MRSAIGLIFLIGTVWGSPPTILGELSRAQDPPENRLARHQGKWEVVRFEREGNVTGAELLKEIRREVDEDHIVWKRNGKNFAGTTFEVNDEVEPHTIDLIPDGGPGRGQRVLGIYRFLEDGTLQICVADAGKDRPSRFESPKESGWTLQTFRKSEPESGSN